jgi:hypothetical protein
VPEEPFAEALDIEVVNDRNAMLVPVPSQQGPLG